jgi:acylphosphatase
LTSDSPKERREIHFSGHVQGVGFRYTTRSIAREFDVTGFVRNLSDGRVQLVVEGRRGELDLFLEALQDRMGHYIRGQTMDSRPGLGDFVDFTIRF